MRPSSSDNHPMQLLSCKLDSIVNLMQGDFVYLEYPVYGNVGDLLIWQGANALFKRHGLKPLGQYSKENVGAGARRVIEKAGTLCFQGGGNFGDLWPSHQNFREEIIAANPHKRIVLFPQSVHFESAEALKVSCGKLKRHPDLHIFLRDKQSLAVLQEQGLANLHLCPDAAHALWGVISAQPPVEINPLYLLRRDKEGSLSVCLPEASLSLWDWGDLLDGTMKAAFWVGERIVWRDGRHGNCLPADSVWDYVAKRLIKRAVGLLAPRETIVTDRLHALILSTLLERKVIVHDNSYGKLSNYVDCWLDGFPNVSMASRA